MVRFNPSLKQNFWFPPKKFLCQRIICDAVEGPGGHIRTQLISALCPVKSQTIFAQSITRMRSIVPRLTAVPSLICPRHDSTFDDGVDVSPIANLRAVTPDFKRIQSQKCACNHCDHCVVFHAARAIHCEVATGSAAQTPLSSLWTSGLPQKPALPERNWTPVQPDGDRHSHARHDPPPNERLCPRPASLHAPLPVRANPLVENQLRRCQGVREGCPGGRCSDRRLCELFQRRARGDDPSVSSR